MIERLASSARWIGALAVVTAGACTARSLEAPATASERVANGVFPQNPSFQLDIVFMIDDSISMDEEQENLVRNFPRFMQVLQDATPPGRTLDAHVAVLSSNLGVGHDQIAECEGPGAAGIFQAAPRGGCAAGPRGNFLVTGPGGNNFDGTIDEAFSCIARLGTGGCGFEQQLASVRRALGGDPAIGMPAENAGFLRPEARLGIVLVTDEDDCSVPVGSDLFRTSDRTLSDPYGPIWSYRCNEFGHLCGGQPPPRGVVSNLTECHSNETDSGRLVRVGDFVRFLRTLKPDPSMLRLAVISGPPAPYGTTMRTGNGTELVDVLPSCTSANGSAAPAVRLHDLVDALGPSALFETICADDFGPTMQHVAEALVDVRPGCLDGEAADRDPATPGLQPDCAVSETVREADGRVSEVAVPACEGGGGPPPGAPACWRLAPDARCTTTPGNLAITVDHGAGEAPPNTQTTWWCRLATP